MTRQLPSALLALLLLTSCASYQARQPDVLQRIQSWEEENEFGRIFSVYDKINPEHPEYAEVKKRLPQIRLEARKYEQAVSNQALEVVKTGDWASALGIYDDGLDHYPNSAYLQSERSKFLMERGVYLDYLERKFQEQQARWLTIALKQQRTIGSVNPDDEHMARRLNSLQEQANVTAQKLGTFGMKAFRENRYATASQALSLSNELVPNEEYQNVLFAIREIAEQEQIVIVKSPSTHPETFKSDTRYATAGALFEEAITENNWPEARRQIERLNTLKPEAKSTTRYNQRYEKAIKPYIAELISEGERQYSQGEFTPALETWQSGIALDPDNKDLKKRILRAEQVLQTLKELSNRSPTIRFPISPDAEPDQ